MSTAFHFARTGRSLRTALILVFIWSALIAALYWLDMALWIAAFLGAFTLPALWDLIRNPPSGLTLTETTLTWHSGTRRATVALDEIDLVRLDTRLDFSIKVTLVLTTGAKIRLPFECIPPHQAFEDALNARALKTRRTHFQLMQ